MQQQVLALKYKELIAQTTLMETVALMRRWPLLEISCWLIGNRLEMDPTHRHDNLRLRAVDGDCWFDMFTDDRFSFGDVLADSEYFRLFPAMSIWHKPIGVAKLMTPLAQQFQTDVRKHPCVLLLRHAVIKTAEQHNPSSWHILSTHCMQWWIECAV